MNFKTEQAKENYYLAKIKSIETKKRNYLKKIDEYNENPKLCIRCGKPLLYLSQRNDFCSRKCALTNNVRNYPHQVNLCITCGKEIGIDRDKFCNKVCESIYKKNISVQKIESEQKISSRTLRDYLLNKYNFKCQRCGWGEINPVLKIPCLDLHHVDGNGSNNVLSNVELLCPNCHSLTSTYKRLNGKSSRVNRK